MEFFFSNKLSLEWMTTKQMKGCNVVIVEFPSPPLPPLSPLLVPTVYISFQINQSATSFSIWVCIYIYILS